MTYGVVAETVMGPHNGHSVHGPGASDGIVLGVIVNNLVGSHFVPSFSFDAPIITWGWEQNLAAAGGTLITVDGLNFGRMDLTPSGQIGDGNDFAVTLSWTSETNGIFGNNRVDPFCIYRKPRSHADGGTRSASADQHFRVIRRNLSDSLPF